MSKKLQKQRRLSANWVTKENKQIAVTSIKYFFLNNLDQLTKDVDLNGVEIIEKDQKLIFQARVEVEKQAKVMLQKGLESQNQSQVNLNKSFLFLQN